MPYTRVNKNTIRLKTSLDVSSLADEISNPNTPYSNDEAMTILNAMIENDIIALNENIDTHYLYDVFNTALIGIRDIGEITPKNANEYFQMIAKLESTVTDANKFSTFGKIFSSPVFEDKMLREIADTIRVFSGPSKSEGLYPCNRCGASRKEVTSEVIQRRSADEAPTVFNACNKCGARWKING